MAMSPTSGTTRPASREAHSPFPGVAPLGFEVREKRELWADNAADLYEEAIQRRWVPATDIPWDTIETLPDDVEAAMCQLCTELSQYASTEIDVIGGWQQSSPTASTRSSCFSRHPDVRQRPPLRGVRKRALPTAAA